MRQAIMPAKLQGLYGTYRVQQHTLLLAICLMTNLLGPGQARADLQADFQAARQALAQNRMAEYDRLRLRLDDYVLAPYLDYERWRRLPRLNAEHLTAMLRQHPGAWFTEQLRQTWLEQRATDEAWADYLRFALPVGDNITHQCRYRYALVQTGQPEAAWPGMEPLWLSSGKPQPAPCELLFNAWGSSGLRSTSQLEARIVLALQARDPNFAKTLSSALPAARKSWWNLALDAYNSPAQTLKLELPPELAALALHRLADSDASAALRLWPRHSPAFGTDLRTEVADQILNRLIKQEPSDVMTLLAQLPASALSTKAQEQRLRLALMARDWQRLAQWAEALPEPRPEEWRYWQAHAWETLGETERARTGFAALAPERTFYGFLAADRVGQGYRFDTTPLANDVQQQQALAARPALQRLREALSLEMETEAKREWASTLPGLNDLEAQAAIRLLDQWDWPDQAQFALARRGFWQDLEFRFPLRHQTEVEAAASAQQLDPAWIYGVIRQESVFNPKARSSANARGLMQLLPETAQLTARRAGLALPGTASLFLPEINILLGSAYLRQLHDRFDGHLALATAGYNAGPNRPAAWRQENTEDMVRWVELIPFRETRTYVKRVLSYRVLYQWRLGLPVQKLSEVLAPP